MDAAWGRTIWGKSGVSDESRESDWTTTRMKIAGHAARLQFVLACAFILGCTVVSPRLAAQSAQSSDEGQILALENAWNQAELQHDPAALELILTDDFVITEPDGTLQTKREHMRATKDTSYHYEALVSEGFRIKLYGTVAVVTGTYHERGSSKGAHFDRRGRFTDTWIKLDGTWHCVASHDSLPVKG